MTGSRGTPSDPWWASGRSPQDGLDGSEDPFDAHWDARRGATDDAAEAGDRGGTGDPPPAGGDAARLVTEVLELVGRLAAEAGRRMAERAGANAAGPHPGAFTRPDPADGDVAAGAAGSGNRWARMADGVAPHADGQVCDACPVCIALRALRQVRPEVVGHLSDAAHHVSLALRAFADAQTGDTEGLHKIDLDP